MKKNLTSLRTAAVTFAIGLGMGVVYWLLHTESPAPALLGLAGLLGIVVGEEAIQLLRARVEGRRRRDP